MQSSTPNGQFSHPNHSVHALKPLTKILPFGAPGRKPMGALRQVPPQAWSIDVKYRCLGLIGAETADLRKSRGQSPGGGFCGPFSAKGGSHQLPADIEEFLPALLADRVGTKIAQLVERLRDGLAGGCDHRLGVAMRAAGRLPQNGIDHAK